MTQAQATTQSDLTSRTCTHFEGGTFGALLEEGSLGGWPSAYTAQVGGATISVSASFVKPECQHGCATKSEVDYIRIGLDFEVVTQGERHTRHVEELFPCQITTILNQPLDEDAAQRVRASFEACLGGDPIALFLANPIAPMRLYEPILAALIPPVKDSFDDWLAEHMGELLEASWDDEELLMVEAGDYRARIQSYELRRGDTLRAQGEFKLVGEFKVECPQSGQAKGQWKSRAILVKPSLKRRTLPAPDAEQITRLHEAAKSWRETLQDNVKTRLESGRAPIMLSDVVPDFDVSAILNAS